MKGVSKQWLRLRAPVMGIRDGLSCFDTTRMNELIWTMKYFRTQLFLNSYADNKTDAEGS
jgi:hypothetical protein